GEIRGGDLRVGAQRSGLVDQRDAHAGEPPGAIRERDERAGRDRADPARAVRSSGASSSATASTRRSRDVHCSKPTSSSVSSAANAAVRASELPSIWHPRKANAGDSLRERAAGRYSEKRYPTPRTVSIR